MKKTKKNLQHWIQLKAFCAVVRRIHKGELEDRGTYRHILYSVFGFGPESYAQAQDAGYFVLHNAIVDSDYVAEMLRAFCRANKIDNYEEMVTEFLI